MSSPWEELDKVKKWIKNSYLADGRMCVLLKAKDYYGPHATGTVILVNGHPMHFTSPHEAKQSKYYPRQGGL